MIDPIYNYMEVFLMIADLVILLPLLIGIALLILEIFLPGFGVPGICGLILEGISIYFAATRYGTVAALIVTAVVLIITGLAVFLSFRSATKGRLSKTSLILKDTEKADDATAVPAVAPGDEGSAITPLRPSGIAVFGDLRLDVIADGEFVDRDQKVRVLRLDGSKVIVRKI